MRAMRLERHSLWDDLVEDLVNYPFRPRRWAKMIVTIAHNAKAFDVHFIFNRAKLLKCKPYLIMNGLNIVCMKMEQILFLDSVSFLPCPLRKLPASFRLMADKSFYTNILIPKKT